MYNSLFCVWVSQNKNEKRRLKVNGKILMQLTGEEMQVQIQLGEFSSKLKYCPLWKVNCYKLAIGKQTKSQTKKIESAYDSKTVCATKQIESIFVRRYVRLELKLRLTFALVLIVSSRLCESRMKIDSAERLVRNLHRMHNLCSICNLQQD